MKKSLIIIIIIVSIIIVSCNSTNTIEEISDECKIFNTKLELGDYYEFAVKSEIEGDYKSALKYYKQAYEYGGIWDDPIMRIYSLVGLSRIHIYIGNYELALQSITETEVLNEELNNLEIQTMIYENYGMVFYYKENYERSEINFLRALDNYTKCKIYASIANIYNNLGLIYTKNNLYNDAEKYLFKAVKLNSQLDRYYQLSINFTNLGLLYKTMNDFENSEKAFLKALEIDKREKHSDLIGKDLFNLGELYYINEKYEESLQYIDKSIIYVQSLQFPSTKYLYLAVDACEIAIKIAIYQEDLNLEEDYKAKKAWFVKKLKERGEYIIDDNDNG